MLSLIGILLGVAAFIGIAFIGFNTIFVSLGAASIVAAFGGMNPFTALAEKFMPSATGFVTGYFLIFMFSALLARIMGDSGAAPSIALKLSRMVRKIKNPRMQRFMAVMCIPIINMVLTYGGVNTFVVVFLMVTIARSLFKELDIPWSMYTCGFLGSATITVGMLPGSPQMSNLVPMEFFGTDTMAAPVLGIVCAILGLIIGCGWIWFQTVRNEKKSLGFFPTGALVDKDPLAEVNIDNEKPLILCLIPMVVVFVILNILKWGAVCALFSGCLVGWLIFNPTKLKLKDLLAGAVPLGVMPLLTVACASGFGGVVRAVPGFTFVTDSLATVGINPFTVVLITNICAGICGSSSSGERITLDCFADMFLKSGVSAPTLHRLVAMSSMGLDTLPHCAGVITCLSTTKMTHRQCYLNIFVMSVAMPIVVSIIAAAMVSMGLFA